MSDFHALLPSNAVTIADARTITTSLVVADVFGKQHKDVLRDIRDVMSDCPDDFNERNFAPVDYRDAKGERRPMFELSKDGFTILAMGYTGSEAMKFKVAYIRRFNEMEAALRQGFAADPDLVTIRRDHLQHLATLMEMCRTFALSVNQPQHPSTAAALPAARQPDAPHYDYTHSFTARVSTVVADQTEVTTSAVCAGLNIEVTRSHQTQIGIALRKLGWRPRQIWDGTSGTKRRVFFRSAPYRTK